jgi:hypothetical protein
MASLSSERAMRMLAVVPSRNMSLPDSGKS